MSIRTIIEINHDYMPQLPELFLAVLKQVKQCNYSNDHLPSGIRILGERHHSEPEWIQKGSDEPPTVFKPGHANHMQRLR